MLQEVLLGNTKDYWLGRFEAEDVPCAPVLDRQSLVEHPQIIENGLVVESHHPVGGPMRQARPAARFDGERTPIRRPAPSLGEHSDEILAEAGLDRETIERLRREGTAE